MPCFYSIFSSHPYLCRDPFYFYFPYLLYVSEYTRKKNLEQRVLLYAQSDVCKAAWKKSRWKAIRDQDKNSQVLISLKLYAFIHAEK